MTPQHLDNTFHSPADTRSIGDPKLLCSPVGSTNDATWNPSNAIVYACLPMASSRMSCSRWRASAARRLARAAS